MKKQKTEFSKIIIIIVGAVTVLVTAFTMYMIWETKDLSPFIYLIPAIFTETASATGFYFWKSKNENLKKMAKEIKEENISSEDISAVQELINNNNG